VARCVTSIHTRVRRRCAPRAAAFTGFCLSYETPSFTYTMKGTITAGCVGVCQIGGRPDFLARARAPISRRRGLGHLGPWALGFCCCLTMGWNTLIKAQASSTNPSSLHPKLGVRHQGLTFAHGCTQRTQFGACRLRTATPMPKPCHVLMGTCVRQAAIKSQAPKPKASLVKAGQTKGSQ
jgi:hypothetical protein